MFTRFLILSLLVPGCCQAQFTQTLRGRIVDKESNYPLAGATVQVTDASLGGLTDTSGVYRIAGVPVGRRTVRVTLVGYKDVLLNNIIIDAGRETILNVELEETMRQLAAVTVKA